MRRISPIWTLGALVGLTLGLLPRSAAAQFDLDREPINYTSTPGHDAIGDLQRRLDAGQSKLDWDAKSGYLAALLKELKISDRSQVLVFSKTSFQRDRISPKTPRALYFNDDVYLGWVPNGSIMELAAMDPDQGVIYYSLDQTESRRPKIARQNNHCLLCHASSNTADVPGHLLRSITSDATGLPVTGSSSFRPTDRSPLSERWGGWYVTGTHGRQRHMGNVVARNAYDADPLDRERGANVTSLASWFDTSPYRTGHSDIVALMVLEHQAPLQNQFTLANYQTRLALRDQRALDELDGKPAATLSEGIQHRIDGAAKRTVEQLLFVDEATLTDPIQGTSGYAEQFAKLGPFDAHGRSLRQFDLRRRLFKYPCSYLIYSPQFDALPPQLKESVVRQLGDVLTGKDQSKPFAALSANDRQAIREILIATKPELAKPWRLP